MAFYHHVDIGLGYQHLGQFFDGAAAFVVYLPAAGGEQQAVFQRDVDLAVALGDGQPFVLISAQRLEQVILDG